MLLPLMHRYVLNLGQTIAGSEYDALDLINMNTINYYYLVKEEGGE